MINNINILSGRVSEVCDNWSRSFNGEETYFKVYLPLKGEALIKVNGEEHIIKPGSLYFLSGEFIETQIVKEKMELVWAHFNVDILNLQVLLKKNAYFHSVPVNLKDSSIFDFTEFPVDNHSLWLKKNNKTNLRPEHLFFICKLSTLIYIILTDIIKNIDFKEMYSQMEVMSEFKKALDYMDQNYLKNPSLQEVAKKAGMAPNYFHRKFKTAFEISPYIYMLQKRMDKAKNLLLITSHSIKEIAVMSGYANEFYFSKTFKKFTGSNPRDFRVNNSN
jgi:AraC-like DNA-binding protein